MGGSAVLDPNVLVDSLVADVIDGLRDELHPQFGVRPFRVYTVKRTWTGADVGLGTSSDVIVELRPQPAVNSGAMLWGGGTRFVQTPGGMTERGDVVLTEVSLTYTYAELVGPTLAANQQWLYKLSEANGQGKPDRYYTVAKPPSVDREKDMGWIITLHHAAQPGCP